MNKISKQISHFLKATGMLAILGLAVSIPATANAQQTYGEETESVIVEESEPQPLSGQETQALIDSVTAWYTPWQELSMSGKFSAPNLPLSPSVKVYMEKGKLVILSFSAPLIGEAVRIEVDTEQMLAVNKLNNTYTQVPMSQLEALCPGGVETLQNTLLGRVTMQGGAELTSEMASALAVYPYGDEGYALFPLFNYMDIPYVYYCIVNNTDYRLANVSVTDRDGNALGGCNYDYSKNKTALDFAVLLKNRVMSGKLTLDSRDSTTKKITRFSIPSKYKKVEPAEIMKM